MSLKKPSASDLATYFSKLGVSFYSGGMSYGMSETSLSTEVATLDSASGCGGVPRGKLVMAYGAYSVGKCTDGASIIPIPGIGLLRMDELASRHGIPKDTPSIEATPVHPDHTVNHQGEQPITRVWTTEPLETREISTYYGNSLICAEKHHLLAASPSGLATWTAAADLRPDLIIFGRLNTKAHGTTKLQIYPDDELTSADILAMIHASERRVEDSADLSLTTAESASLTWVRQLINAKNLPNLTGEAKAWQRFTGIFRFTERWQEWAVQLVHPDWYRRIRTSPATTQARYLATLALLKGYWPDQETYEIELEREETAKTFQALALNFGVRTVLYKSLSTQAQPRWKLALRDRTDQNRFFQPPLYLSHHKIPRTQEGGLLQREDELPDTLHKAIINTVRQKLRAESPRTRS